MFPYPKSERMFSAYNLGVTIVWPNLMMFTKRDWRGQEHVGKDAEGLVLASNHMTWIDPFILLHYVNDAGRPARFLAKDSLFDIPVAGGILSGAGTIPVHRETGKAEDAVSSAVEAVQSGELVFVYPEGTITRDPDLWPMSGKTGAARIALFGEVPLIPVAQWGAHEIMGPYKKELRLFPRKTMHVVAGAPVDLDDLRGIPVTSAVLEEATTRLMDDITALEAGLRNETPPSGRWDRRAGERRPIVHGVSEYERLLASESKDGEPDGTRADSDTEKSD